MKDAFLILENGTIFPGKRIGADEAVIGELVFTTGMCGYLKTLTNPNYFGQIVVQTFPLIGNYGLVEEEAQGEKTYLKGYIVREIAEHPSNFRSKGKIEDYLAEQGVVCLTDIDTRSLTRIIRDYGVMNARISDTPTLTKEEEEALKGYYVKDAVKTIAPKKEETFGEGEKRVVIINFGMEGNLTAELLKRGFEVVSVPYNTSFDRIKELNPSGIILSNGPGDPTELADSIKTVAELAKSNIPMMGVGLGHQILALAMGGKTIKLKYGHRGASQPVMDEKANKVYITTQNHGYAVAENTLPKDAEVRFYNLNDRTVEGIEYTNIPAFSVQFYPETAKGPHNLETLFDQFQTMIQEVK